MNDAKKKLLTLTLNIVGKTQLSCHGIPPIKRYSQQIKKF